MPLDYAGLTIARLWALLEANSTWLALVKPGNRIKRVGVDNPRPGKLANNVQEFPQLDIRLVGGAGSAFAAPAPRTFGQCSFILQATRTFALVYTVDELRYDAADPLVALTEQILCAAGADLGLPEWCVAWGPYNWTRREVITDTSAPVRPEPNRKRIEDTITLTVSYRIPKATLLA